MSQRSIKRLKANNIYILCYINVCNINFKCKTTILFIKYITFLVYFKFLLFYLNSNIKMYLNFNEFRTCIDFFTF